MPIPRGLTTDPRLPLQHRGIALISTVYTIYTCTLNNRIVLYMEDNCLYAFKQMDLGKADNVQNLFLF